jgi:prepilin-type N-terminal cleavage/methylation domain-containing protein
MKAAQAERTSPSRAGYTLAELMIASVIAAIVVLGMATAFLYSYRLSWTLRETQAMSQEMRYSMSRLTMELASARYGTGMAGTNLSAWFSWVGGLNTNPLVRPGVSAGDPDSITLVGVFGPSNAALASGAAAGTNSIRLTAKDWSAFDTLNQRVIFIGHAEMARIVSISGDRLTISTHPSTNTGLQFSHVAGEPVESVQAVNYVCERDAGTGACYLRREDYAPGLQPDDFRIARGIEDLQMTQTSNAITVTLTGRTQTPDSHYRDPVHHDGYHRRTMQTTVYLRNSP